MKKDTKYRSYKAFVKKEKTVIDHIARFAGDIKFVYLHLAFFALWMIWNSLREASLDPFPYILLTLIVSLEAIFLSTFVLINQNRDAQRSERRARLDFEIDKQAEQEIREIKTMLDDIQKSLKK